MADLGDLQKLIAGLTSGFESVRQGLKDDSDDDDDDEVASAPAKATAPAVAVVVPPTSAEAPRQLATTTSPAQTPATTLNSYSVANSDITATFVGKVSTPQQSYSDIPTTAGTFVAGKDTNLGIKPAGTFIGGSKSAEYNQAPPPDYSATFVGNKPSPSPLKNSTNNIVPSFLPSNQRSKQSTALDQVPGSFMPQYHSSNQISQASTEGTPASFVPGFQALNGQNSSVSKSFVPGYNTQSIANNSQFVPGQRQQSVNQQVPQSFVPGYQSVHPQPVLSPAQAHNAISTLPPQYSQATSPQYQQISSQNYQSASSLLTTSQSTPIVVAGVSVPSQPAPSGLGVDAKRLQALKAQNALRQENVKAKRQAIDIAFMMDITGTMVPWLDLAKNKIDQIISRIEQKFPDAQTRVAFVGYSDWDNRRPPRQHNVVYNFCKPAELKELIKNVQKGDGWDCTEDVLGADDPPHGREFHDYGKDNDRWMDEPDPSGRGPKQVFEMIRMMCNKEIEYHFFHLDKQTEIMEQRFDQELRQYGSQLFVHTLTQDVDSFLPAFLAAVTESMSRSKTRG
ncbi:hypothetical protein HK096_004581 [Nowakowskiella sp. JEL0078]|nr:hypothetical protein HK096_004581 [Nowakowskiella sp. JEL0078]